VTTGLEESGCILDEAPAQPPRQNGVGDDTGTPDESLAAA
jgi:hypothetical protein